MIISCNGNQPVGSLNIGNANTRRLIGSKSGRTKLFVMVLHLWVHGGDVVFGRFISPATGLFVIGIDHDMVCAGVFVPVGAGASGRTTAGTTRAVPDSSTTHDNIDRISGQFLFYHDHRV